MTTYAKGSYRSRYRRRTFRRPTYRQTRRTRFRRRRRTYRNRTTSKTVKLTMDAVWMFNTTSSGPTAGQPVYWYPFSFSPAALPGFSDYQSTYTHFRISKANLYISRNVDGSEDPTKDNYLVVGSRPFAAVNKSITDTSADNAYVPRQTEEALRQVRWQTVKYPSTTSQRLRIGFHPYTMVGTFGPGTPGVYQRIWEARRWMPFVWAYTGPPEKPDGPNVQNFIEFFGPYMVVNTGISDPTVAFTGTCTLEVYVQFKGQR